MKVQKIYLTQQEMEEYVQEQERIKEEQIEQAWKERELELQMLEFKETPTPKN